MSNNDWQGKLRSKMDGYSEPLPDSVWNAVESGVASVWDRRRRIRRRRRMFAGGASVCAAAALAVAVLLPDRGTVLQPAPGPRLAQSAAPALSEEFFRMEDARPLDAAHSRVLDDVTELPAPMESAGVPPQEDLQADTGNGPEEMPSSSEPGGRPVEPEPEQPCPPSEIFGDAAFSAREEEHGKKLRVSLGLRASNVAPGRSESAGYGGMYGASVVPAQFSRPDQMLGYSSVLLNNNSRSVSTSTEHWQPVSVGLAVSLGLGGNFSLESGLNYSCLVSDMSSGTAENHYDIRQTLHYIGLPLKARFSFWRPGGFDLYLTAGGEVEKCVGGNTSTSYVVNSSERSVVKDRIIVEPLQWSVGASLGLGYSFSELLGIYVEPGVSYHFDNGSFVETVYRERPFNFSLSLGLRFNLE